MRKVAGSAKTQPGQKYINKLQAIKQNTCDKFHQVEVVSALPSVVMGINLLGLL